jgi:hypothetical protein
VVHRRFRNLVTPRTPGGQIKVTNEPNKPRQANQFSRPFEAEPAPEAATLGFEHGDPRPRTGVVPGGTRTTRRHCGGYRGQRFRGQRVRIRRRTHGWLGGRRRHWGKRNGLCVGGAVSDIIVLAAGNGFTSAPVVMIDPPPPPMTPAALSLRHGVNDRFLARKEGA